MPSPSESLDNIIGAVEEGVPHRFRDRVLAMHTDNPLVLVSGAGRLRAALRNVSWICEDPVHGMIRLLAISGGRPNALSSGV